MWALEVDAALVRRMENMSDMLNRLGLDPILAGRRDGGAILGSAVRVCEACPAVDVCHDWLARAATTLYRAPAFCPNADRFAQLLAEETARNRIAGEGIDASELMKVARQCFILAERCTDREIAGALDGMGRHFVEKATRDRRRPIQPSG